MKEQRSFPREVKMEAVRRNLAGERTSLVAAEFEIRPTLLHQWVAAYRREGLSGLRPTGRPSREARLNEVVSTQIGDDLVDPAVLAERKIALLERKVTKQALELDFFKAALLHLEPCQPITDRQGAPMSTPSSTGGHRGKAKD